MQRGQSAYWGQWASTGHLGPEDNMGMMAFVQLVNNKVREHDA